MIYHVAVLKACEEYEDDVCCVCLDEEIDVGFLPCHHRIFCETCAIQLDTCPFCRAVIKNRESVNYNVF